MSSKFFGNKHDSQSGSRGNQKTNMQGNRTNNKRNQGVKKSGRGR